MKFKIATLISRMIFLAAIILCVYFIAGFFKYKESVFAANPNLANQKFDGIVSLTGGSRARLQKGVYFLEQGKGQKLLISGVYEKATKSEIRALLGGDKALYDCCIELGKSATDTIGNAAEIKEWAAKNNYKSLLIITDNYHMPRALYEIRKINKNIKLTAYKTFVPPYINSKITNNEKVRNMLFSEYGKLILAKIRRNFGLEEEIDKIRKQKSEK